MRTILAPLSTLFLGTAILISGHGLLTTLVPVRVGQLGSSAAMTGAIATGYFIGLVVGALCNPRIIHRVGRIRALAGFAAIFAATALLLPLIPWPPIWIVVRGVAGVCLAGLTLVIESWLNTVTGSAHRGRVLAVYMIIYYGAFGGGQFLLFAYDPGGFELFALSAILLGMSLVPIVLTRTEDPPVAAPAKLNLTDLMRVSPMAVFGSVSSGIILGAFYGLAPLFAVVRGMSTDGVALFMAAAIFGGLALQWPIGMVSDRMDRRMVILGTAAVSALSSAAIAFNPASVGLLQLVSVAVFGGATFTLYPLSLANAGDRLAQDGDVVALSSGMLLLYSIGAAIGPLLAGQVFSLLNNAGLFLFTALVGAATVGFGLWRIRRATAANTEDQVVFVAVPRTSPAGAELDPRKQEDIAP